MIASPQELCLPNFIFDDVYIAIEGPVFETEDFYSSYDILIFFLFLEHLNICFVFLYIMSIVICPCVYHLSLHYCKLLLILVVVFVVSCLHEDVRFTLETKPVISYNVIV